MSTITSSSVTMPTLLNQTEDVSVILDGETADTAGCLWFSEHLLNGNNVAPTDSISRRKHAKEYTNTCSSTGTMIGDETQRLLGVSEPQSRTNEQNGPPEVPPLSCQQNIQDDSDCTLSSSAAPLSLPHEPINNGIDQSLLSSSVSRTYDDEDLALRQLCSLPNKTVLQDLSNRSFFLSSSNYMEKINEHSQRLPRGPCVNNSFHDPKGIPSGDRKMGSNECIYMQQYHSHISSEISTFRDKYPGKLPDYSTLTDDKKLIEQQFVMDLLQRLRVSNGIVGTSPVVANEGAFQERVELSLNAKDISENESMVESSVDLLSPPPGCPPLSTTPDKTDTDALFESSMDLLSPPPEHPPIDFSPIAAASDMRTSVALLSHPRQEMEDSSSTQSIEIARAAVPFDSPNFLRHEKKRFASTSGKRGADMSRIRLEDMDAPSPSKFLVNSIDRLSLKEDNETIFSASQSPIVATSPYSPMQQNHGSSMESISSDISFGEDNEQAICVRPLYDNDSIVETAMLPDQRVHWDYDGKLTKDAPTDVRLADGETMRWPKLPTELRQRNASPTQTFRDPFAAYAKPLRRRLEKVYAWILHREKTDSRLAFDRYAVVLTISFLYVTDVIIKLHLEHPYAKDLTLSNRQHALHGNTLIVTRSKDELDLLKRSFREGSALSVLNHASLPNLQRKSQSCADKSVHFDVVLTTYDALKSPDMALKIDLDGFAITTSAKSDDGWFTSSSSQSVDQLERNCRQLSALHRVNWRRLILVDVLGRKSFLSKLDTTRVKAVRAINADSRLVFFLASEDDTVSGIQALVKSDRTALASLSSVLRMKRDEADMSSLLDDVVLDFNAMPSSTA